MILTDYFTEDNPIQWRRAKQLGVDHGVIRLPEREGFDLGSAAHWQSYLDKFQALGIRPLVVEPLPNSLYEPVKSGLPDAQERMEELKQVIALMGRFRIPVLCLNFMAHVGWYRSDNAYPLRGGALGTSFRLSEYRAPDDFQISPEALWRNLEAFLREIVPVAQKHEVRLAFHPDDPPVCALGGVSRILTSLEAIHRAVNLVQSDCLGVTLCQGCYAAMGEDVVRAIHHFGRAGKLFFVHFRDVAGQGEEFHETFHDDGPTDMAKVIRAYREVHYQGPVRVDHVPTLAGEENTRPGYASLGRLYALGYLRGLLHGTEG